jgi:hypothetical protein
MDSGYLDTSNRQLIAMFVLQERYDTAQGCESAVSKLSPFSAKRRRKCLNPASTPVYNSEYCGNVSSPTSANCFRYPEFFTNNLTNAFSHNVFSGTFGFDSLTEDNVLCRLNSLKSLGWLDYRTQRVCLIFFTFNEMEDGRYALYRECVMFEIGGRAILQRELASLPLMTTANTQTPIILTWTYFAFNILWGMMGLTRTYHAMRRRELLLSIVCDLVLFSLGVVCCVGYLDAVDDIRSFKFRPVNESAIVDASQYYVRCGLACEMMNNK